MKVKKATLYGYIFFSPFFLVYFMFRLIPFAQSVWMTLHQWEVLTPPQFIGLENFHTLFTTARFWTSLWNTIQFTIITVPPLVIFGFIIAVLVNGRIFGKSFFRFAFYLPNILSISVVCLTWLLMLNRSHGIVNVFLKNFGIQPIAWVSDPNFAMLAVGMTTIWWSFGFNFLVYLSSLQQIPDSVYEAAQIDGAGWLQRLIRVTLPILSRTHAVVIVLQILASLQIFGQVYIMTGGGPGGRTRVLIQYVYEEGFRFFNMGYAQAIAFVFFIFMTGVAYLQIRLMETKE